MIKPKQMDWKQYESITKYIYEKLGEKSGIEIECYGNSCKVTGKSTVKHQIDVLTKHSDGIHNYRTAIECKYWKDKINKDIVMKVANIIEDAGIEKGVIVSKEGFTKDGIEFAKYKNIGLVELKEYEGEKGIFEIKTTLHRPEILRIGIDMIDTVNKNSEATNIYKLIVKLKDGKEIPFFDITMRFKNDLHKEEIFKVVSKRYEYIGASLINKKDNSKINIRAIDFTGVLTRRDSGLKFYPSDQTWLIMKSIFEETTFTISEKGVIREMKK